MEYYHLPWVHPELNDFSRPDNHECTQVAYIGISASPTGEAVTLSTGAPIPAQWTCRRRCRDRADIEQPELGAFSRPDNHECTQVAMPAQRHVCVSAIAP